MYRPVLLPPPRQNSCTHVTMTRLHGFYKCDLCHLYSTIGWVYICTADTDYTKINDPSTIATDTIDQLRPSLEPDHPTDHCFNMAGTDIHSSIKSYLLSPSTDGISANETLPESEAYTDQQRQTLREQKTSLELATTRYKADGVGSMDATHCQMRCCHRCRPTFVDRAWERLDSVANNQVKIFHLDNRPVSLVHHVENLGRRPVSYESFPDFGLENIEFDSDCSVEGRARTSFRAGLSKAYRRLRGESSAVEDGIVVREYEDLTTYDACAVQRSEEDKEFEGLIERVEGSVGICEEDVQTKACDLITQS